MVLDEMFIELFAAPAQQAEPFPPLVFWMQILREIDRLIAFREHASAWLPPTQATVGTPSPVKSAMTGWLAGC